jgi:lysophospholipase L1-like esterase
VTLPKARWYVWTCGCALALACSTDAGAPIDASGGTAGASFGASGPAGGSGNAGSSGSASTAGSNTTGGSALGGNGSAGAGAGGASAGNGGTPSTGGGGASGASAGSGGNAGASGNGAAGAAGFAPCPSAPGTPCAVLPLGDSITEGFGSSGGGYRVELFRQALQNDQRLTFVGTLQNGPNDVEGQAFPKRHQGHGGFTIDSGGNHSGISGSITQTALDMFHPHIVLLMIGTNDINGNIDVGNAPTRLGNLIDDITARAPSALVVVATIIPVANEGTNQKVQAYNAALPAVVNARASAGKHVVLLDNYAAFVKTASYASTLMGDYLHPNDAGYAVLGRAFYDLIGPLLPGE